MATTDNSKKTKKKMNEGESENKNSSIPPELVDGMVVMELKKCYKSKLQPIEKQYIFDKFRHPPILDSELQAKPTVLLIGQYSTGKTTFIRHLIGMDYPDIHIGPEPTTDKFVAVVYGKETKTIMGNALTGVDDLPFSGLSTFGSSFLSKFSAAVVPAPILKNINIIDTPGVLSGEKQRNARGYDFSKVSRWFAERSDLILLMFDCSKLDISDEFKLVIEELQSHEDKVHCVLNKASTLDTEQLIRVYGSLMWSIGRIFKGAEVVRVYVGSFRDEDEDKQLPLFKKDKEVLLQHLDQLPNACSMRKVNEIVKRTRALIVQVCILGHLKSKMPMLWSKDAAQLKMINDLPRIFEEIRRSYQLSEGDFPNIDEYRADLMLSDFTKFPKTDRKILNMLQDVLTTEIPKIIQHVAGVDPSSRFTMLEDKSVINVNRQPHIFSFSDNDESRLKKTNLIIAFTVLVLVLSMAIAFIQMNPERVIVLLEKFQMLIGQR